MPKTYYVRFSWDFRILYDGYIVRLDDFRVLGFTDESIIAGGGEENIYELQYNMNVISYPINKSLFIDLDKYTGAIKYLNVKEHFVKLYITETSKDEESVYRRILQNSKHFPSIIEQLIKSYFSK